MKTKAEKTPIQIAAAAVRRMSDERLLTIARMAERVEAATLDAPNAHDRKRLTLRQAEVLAFIETHIVKNGWPPALREIGKAFGIKSTNGINDHLNALARKGYITRNKNVARGIRVVTSVAVAA